MDIQAFTDLIRTTVLNHRQINEFVDGSSFEQNQKLTNSSAKVLFILDSPDARWSNDRRSNIGYITEIIIIQQATATATKNTLEILKQVILKFSEMYQNNIFEDFKITSNITQTQIDSLRGWRCTAEFYFDENITLNEEEWLH